MLGTVPFFHSYDGTRHAYRETGSGDPVLCIPGGPTDSGYLGDLGGLSDGRRLILLDPRGTGGSAIPGDVASYRCDRLVEDVAALRGHLGLARTDVLGNSAGVGVEVEGEARRALARQRRDEPWFPEAYAALEALTEGRSADFAALAPFFWGRWDEEAQRHPAARPPANPDAVRYFAAEGAFDPPAARAGLAAYRSPVFVLAGEFDLNSPPESVAEIAALFPAGAAEYAVQPGAGHYPWVDDPERFGKAVGSFLAAWPARP
jgi:proline iminopeptidase